jgi:uncharacterized protein (TIGR02284 family)
MSVTDTGALPANPAIETIPVLNHLITVCKDGELGFRSAAEDVGSPACRDLFFTYAQQRAQFVAELQNAVRKLGAQPEEDGSITGLLHREWMDVRSRFARQNMNAVISEVERGEDVAMRAYRDALRLLLTEEARELLTRQFEAVRTAHENVRSLRDIRRGD